ncbi:histidine phosphatase family protein [Bacillus sp. FJAT-47783]|uniref:histidine phosphatase family protein n=1 Tax=Bacillus sp. FJAT-47783 TaxID=2922712 RepID=UPI001FAD4205|nr:histidine phosphatase family protein [Bacillus sp. FJAT-47783]
MDDRVVITLIRHGLTKENEEKRYIGWTNSPLSEEGKNRLQTARTNFSPQLVFSSDLLRCIETAAYFYPENERIELSELREIHFGDWEGKTYEQLKNNTYYQGWLNDPFTSPIPSGETYDTFSNRVQKAWMNIVNEFHDQSVSHIAIVTHGGVIREILSKVSPECKSYWAYTIKPGGCMTLIGNRSKVRRGEPCILLQEGPLTENESG